MNLLFQKITLNYHTFSKLLHVTHSFLQVADEEETVDLQVGVTMIAAVMVDTMEVMKEDMVDMEEDTMKDMDAEAVDMVEEAIMIAAVVMADDMTAEDMKNAMEDTPEAQAAGTMTDIVEVSIDLVFFVSIQMTNLGVFGWDNISQKVAHHSSLSVVSRL